MPVYDRDVVVDAPFDEVWDFHSRPSGLEALTPDWLHLVVESVEGPDGNPDPEVLVSGSKVRSSIRPFGVGPRQHWTSYIVTRRREGDRGLFRDEMTRGPFPHWEHTHRFEAVEDGTRVHDRVEYRLPGGTLGRLGRPFGVVGLEAMFRHRHRRTKELLE